jgi:hypothetical protein
MRRFGQDRTLRAPHCRATGVRIGDFFTVLVILLAIILAVGSGNPLVPLLLGGFGVIVWLVAIGLKRILADNSLRGSGR